MPILKIECKYTKTQLRFKKENIRLRCGNPRDK